MNIFLGRAKKLEQFKSYTVKDKDVYIVSSDNLNNEHNIYGYLFYKKERLTHAIIGNNSVTKDGCFMRGLMPAKFLDNFSSDDIDTVIDRIRMKYNHILENLQLTHVMSPKKLTKSKTGFICLKVLVINLFLTYIRGESNKTFSNKMISELLSGIVMRPFESVVGQKITPINSTENLLLNEMSKIDIPLYPILIDSSLFKGASIKCVDSYLLKTKIENSKVEDFYVFTMEDCGQVLSKYISNGLLLGDVFNDLEAIKALLFQVFFSVYILNRYGYIHGDMHLNNVTARESVVWKDMVNYSSTSCYCLYRDNLLDSEFYVKFHGAFPTLIDFGRAKNVDTSEKTIHKIKIELDLELTHPLEMLQASNMLDMLRIMKGLLTLLKTTETETRSEVKDFIQMTIDEISTNKPDYKISLACHMAKIINTIFDSLKKKVNDSEVCMTFDVKLNESMLALRADIN